MPKIAYKKILFSDLEINNTFVLEDSDTLCVKISEDEAISFGDECNFVIAPIKTYVVTKVQIESVILRNG